MKQDPNTLSGLSLTRYSDFSPLDTSNKLPAIGAPGGPESMTRLEQEGARHADYPPQTPFLEGIVLHMQELPQCPDSRQLEENLLEFDQPRSNVVADIAYDIQVSG